MYGNLPKIDGTRDKIFSICLCVRSNVQLKIRKNVCSLLFNGISVDAFIYRTSIELDEHLLCAVLSGISVVELSKTLSHNKRTDKRCCFWKKTPKTISWSLIWIKTLRACFNLTSKVIEIICNLRGHSSAPLKADRQHSPWIHQYEAEYFSPTLHCRNDISIALIKVIAWH